MSVLQEPASTVHASLTRARLPRRAVAFVAVPAAALATLLTMLGNWSWAVAPILTAAITLVALPAWAGLVEGRRAAVDRAATLLVFIAVLVALTPLVWVLSYTVAKGYSALNLDFLGHDMQGRLDPVTFKQLPGTGVLHAIVGTGLVTAGAALISVPVGMLSAVYLVEYTAGGWLGRTITILVDVMTGIPSIVAGLFAVALFTEFGNIGIRIGLMGSVALSLLMIPTVVRATEEMMRLVPADLREAAYALGVPKWVTILRVVIPTAFGGIITGVMLAISRVIGETAPLLVAVGAVDVVNTNLLSGRMETLPVYIFDQYNQGDERLHLAWGAALLLIVIVMLLNIVARILGKIFAPKTGR